MDFPAEAGETESRDTNHTNGAGPSIFTPSFQLEARRLFRGQQAAVLSCNTSAPSCESCLALPSIILLASHRETEEEDPRPRAECYSIRSAVSIRARKPVGCSLRQSVNCCTSSTARWYNQCTYLRASRYF